MSSCRIEKSILEWERLYINWKAEQFGSQDDCW